MNSKKFLLAALSGFIVMFLLGWVGHELLMPNLSDTNPFESIERSDPSIAGIAVAYLILALIMAYIYPKGVDGNSVAGNGLRFGVLIGVLITLPISLIIHSVVETSTLTNVVTETIWHMIEQGIGGVIIAFIYGRSSSGSE